VTQAQLFRAVEALDVHAVDRIRRARTEAYVELTAAASASSDLRHRRNPPEAVEERAAMDRRLVDARAVFAAAADAWTAVDETSRDAWSEWVRNGRVDVKGMR
jgi:prophage DNA circulation protein